MRVETIVALFYLSIVLFCAALWITNVVKFVKCDFEAPYATEIIRGIGIPVAPMGVVIGLMDIGEENVEESAE